MVSSLLWHNTWLTRSWARPSFEPCEWAPTEEMAFLLLISIAFERRLGLVLKALAIKVTSNAPWDHHTFICLLLRSISIKMLHTKMNKKKKTENMQTITSFLSEKTCWLIKNKNYMYQPHLQLICFLHNRPLRHMPCWKTEKWNNSALQ